MKSVDLYAQVRFAVQIEGISRRAAARRFGIDPRTVAKMLSFSVPSGYRRSRPPTRPKLDPFIGIIDVVLAVDEGRPKKQRHTTKRIFERLREEHGYAGGITIVRDYLRAHRQRHREVFVPLGYDPGHAQVDFGEALAEIAGVERKIHFFAMDLPYSDACFVKAYPAERRRRRKRSATGTTARSVSSARCRARSFTTIRRWAVARILGKRGKREFVQILRLLEVFRLEDVLAGIREAIARGAIGFDAVRHLVLCRIEHRPPRLDLTVYPYLPKARVATTSAKAYLDLLAGAAP